MKITGVRSYILVERDVRTLKITGELTTAPAFYADSISIKNGSLLLITINIY
jgi:hypothetical protein